MLGDKLSVHQLPQSSGKRNPSRQDVAKAQEAIYRFLLEIVKNWEPDAVLKEFKHLFVHHSNTISSNSLPYLYDIVFANQEQEFRNTLKRSCYILINNWDITRNYDSIQKLIQLFSDPILSRGTISPTLKRLREWLRRFVVSTDFYELKLFAARYEERDKLPWSQRYISYLLVPQYINLENSVEQRQAARNLAKQMKEKFKFELAMYTAFCQSHPSKEQQLKNPTCLGDEVLRLIKRIVAKRGIFSYPNIARIFLKQTQNSTYFAFKQSLLEYLIFSIEQDEFTSALRNQLSEKLSVLYSDHDDKDINSALILRTANRVFEYLTTENQQDPSALFVLLLSQGNPLTLVIVLLKIILICPHARTHLEARIADLICYYADYPEAECQWVVNFFEIFRVITTIYTENVEFNLVNMSKPCAQQSLEADTQVYRIFSQIKHQTSLEESNALVEAFADTFAMKPTEAPEVLPAE